MERLVFIDTETTGFSDQDRICQLALKCFNDTHTISQFFKPPVPVGLKAMAVNHITNHQLKGCPAFSKSTTKTYLTSLLEQGYIVVAHNAAFDLKMLEREGIVVDRWIDTMKLSKELGDAKIESHSLQYLRYYFDLDIPGVVPHSAEGDVAVLVALFELLHKKLKKPSIEEMIDISWG